MFRLLLACLLPFSAINADEPVAKDSNGIAIPVGQTLDYERATFEQLAGSYAKYTGFSLKVPDELKHHRLQIFAPGPLTNANLARLIENSFLLHGCIIKRTESGTLQLAIGVGPWRRPAPTEKRLIKDPDPEQITIPEGQSLRFENLTAFECANLLFRHTGKRVLLSPNFAQAEMRINAPGPLNNKQVAAALIIALEKHGMVLKEFTPHEAAILPLSPQAAVSGFPKGAVRVRRVPNR